MNIMKKRISLVLGIIMLTLAIIPMFNVAAVEATCQVSMTATMGNQTLVNNGKYTVHGGEKIVVSAKSSVTGIKFISYYFSTLENGYAVLQTNLETPWKFRDFDEVVGRRTWLIYD